MGAALYTAVTGLQAHQRKTDVIADNIANVNTTGFRGSSVAFQDLFAQTLQGPRGPEGNFGGTNPVQVGLGVSIGSIDTRFTQGTITNTGVNTDMAIEGDGFFTLSDGQTQSYTRDGSFEVNAQGYLIEPATGQFVLGYMADADGAIDTATGLTQLQIPVGGAAIVNPTSVVDFLGNLDSDAGVGTVIERTVQVYDSLGTERLLRLRFVKAPETNAWDWQVATGPQGNVVGNFSTTAVVGDTVVERMRVTDSAGTERLVTITYTKTGANNWDWQASSADPTVSLTGNGTLTFDPAAPSNGRISAGQTGNVAIDYGGGVTANFDLDFSLTSETNDPTNITSYDPPQVSDPAIDTVTGTGTLQFGTDGRVLTGGTGNISVDFVDGDPAVPTDPLLFNLDLSELTQLSGESDAAITFQDGYPRGVLESFGIARDGIINGVYTNGLTLEIGQVGLANFANNGGLERTGNNQFLETASSGIAQVGLPNTGGRGTVSGGVLERSNVDLSTEFSNLIVTQRGFQANARTFTTADAILQETVNLVR